MFDQQDSIRWIDPPGAACSSTSLLDGLRGVAVVVVLFFFHCAPPPPATLGVDLFFVLSGFLITSLLVREAEQTGRVSLRAFWARRARRLLPALLVLVFAVVLAGPFLLPEPDPGAFAPTRSPRSPTGRTGG